MLSKITSFCGSISTGCRQLAALLAKSSSYSVVTILIVLANLIVFCSGLGFPLKLHWEWKDLLLFQFTHANIDHLIFNQLYLVLVGPKCEEYFGSLKYLFIYLFGGLVGAFGYLYVYPGTAILGASGGISTLLIIYPFLHKKFSRMFITALIIGIYFLTEGQLALISLIKNIPMISASLAHVFGAIFGLLIFLIILSRKYYELRASNKKQSK